MAGDYGQVSECLHDLGLSGNQKAEEKFKSYKTKADAQVDNDLTGMAGTIPISSVTADLTTAANAHMKFQWFLDTETGPKNNANSWLNFYKMTIQGISNRLKIDDTTSKKSPGIASAKPWAYGSLGRN